MGQLFEKALNSVKVSVVQAERFGRRVGVVQFPYYLTDREDRDATGILIELVNSGVTVLDWVKDFQHRSYSVFCASDQFDPVEEATVSPVYDIVITQTSHTDSSGENRVENSVRLERRPGGKEKRTISEVKVPNVAKKVRKIRF